MLRKLQETLWFVIENLPPFVTVGVAAYVLVLSQRSTLQTTELLQWLLGIVGLLATSELIERYRAIGRLEKTTSETLSLLKSQSSKPTAIDFFQVETEGLAIDCQDSSEICVSGMNLRRTVTSHFGFFERKLAEGARIRILLVDPNADVVPIIARRNIILRDSRKLKTAIKDSIEHLSRLGQSQSDMHGQIEVRVLKHVPAYGLTLSDPYGKNGKVIVDIYPYQVEPDKYPSFELEKTRDGKWFDFYVEQFEKGWNDASVVYNNKP